jgi:hypothetical protein
LNSGIKGDISGNIKKKPGNIASGPDEVFLLFNNAVSASRRNNSYQWKWHHQSGKNARDFRNC